MKIPPVIAVAALIGCASTPAAPPAAGKSEAVTSDLPIPSDLARAVERAEGVGRQLYVLDKVSAIGTDVLQDQVPRYKDRGLRGYVTFQDATEKGEPQTSFTVSFYTGDAVPGIAFQIHVAPDVRPRLEVIDPPRPATPTMQELMRARQTALEALPQIVQPINPVIVPGPLGKEVLVYLLAGTNRPGIAVFGRHHLARVSPDGRKLLKLEPLSKSILELPLTAPDGGKLEALMVSHIVSEAPIETHVFASLLHKLPVYVATSRGLWRVDGDRIAFIKEQKR